VPVLKNEKDVAARPELTAMSIMMHGRSRVVAETFTRGLELLNSEYALQYYEHTYSMAAPTVRRILEEVMSSKTWPIYSPFAREHFGRGKD
jgi:hypothetical protein